MIKLYQCDGNKNIGDTLTQPIVERILKTQTQKVSQNFCGKLLGIGSIISWALQKNDVVWGSGLIENSIQRIPSCTILALRGKLTAKNINSKCDFFSDPAILLPLIYNPDIEKQHDIGIIEHYVDVGLYHGKGKKISVTQHWTRFIDDIKSCSFILSSSLHGLILAESYGIPCQRLKLSDKIIGGDFKFNDYLTASNRKEFGYFSDIGKYQNQLIYLLKTYYGSK